MISRHWGPRLKNFRTAAIVKSEAFEAVRLVVRAGATVPTHHVPGPITLLCLEGRAVIALPETEVELEPNDWIYLKGGEPALDPRHLRFVTSPYNHLCRLIN